MVMINLTSSDQAIGLSQGLTAVLNASVPKDVILACSEGHCLQAHHLTLTTYSLFFKQILTVCKKPTPTVLLPDVSLSVMEALLEFMYTGSVRVEKDLMAELVEANTRFNITGLDDLFSKHVGDSLPPKKKQRIENPESTPSAKPSSLFRPWDSPVVAPMPEYPVPWMHPVYGAIPLSYSMPLPMAYSNNLSRMMSLPMYTQGNVFSEIAPSLTSLMPWTMPYRNRLSEIAPSLSASLTRNIDIPMSESAPKSFGKDEEKPMSEKAPASKNKPVEISMYETPPASFSKHFERQVADTELASNNNHIEISMSETVPVSPSKHVKIPITEMVPASLNKHVEMPISEKEPFPASIETNVEKNKTETSIPIIINITTPIEPEELPKNHKKHKTSKKNSKVDTDDGSVSNNGKYLVPGKQRCDICNKDFYNITGHKTSAHGLLKKPIHCCGNKFTTRQDFKKHKKAHKMNELFG